VADKIHHNIEVTAKLCREKHDVVRTSQLADDLYSPQSILLIRYAESKINKLEAETLP
jgi:hypothetical protein